MSIVNYAFLPVLLFISLIVAYEDIKLGKIRLKWIKFGLFYSMSAYFVFYLLTVSSVIYHGEINFLYIKSLLVNAFFSLVVAYLLWKLGAWAAGDAKLFIIYSLLIPLEYYSKGYLPYFPSFALLLNIFLPIFLFVFIAAIYQLVVMGFKHLVSLDGTKPIFFYRNKFFEWAKNKCKKNQKEILTKIMGYMLVFMVASFLRSKWNLNPLIVVAIMLIIFKPVTSVAKKNPKFIFFAALSIFAYLSWEVFSWGWKQTFNMMLARMMRLLLVVFGLNLILQRYIKYTQVYELPIEKLKVRMVITENAFVKIGKNVKELKKQLGTVYPDGLSQEQVSMIKGVYIDNNQKVIKVHRTFPFAIWMLAGVVLTLLLKQDIMHYFLFLTGIHISF